MKHIPHSSRVFIGLVIITFLLTYLALALSMQQRNFPTGPSQHDQNAVAVEQKPLLDTTDWKSYQDKNYPLAFLYPKTWTMKSSTNKEKFYDVTINPGAKFQNMHVYISNQGYYALDGLTQTPRMIGNHEGFTIADNLAGVKVGEYYYTFDGSMNTTQIDEFSTLLSTVSFQ